MKKIDAETKKRVASCVLYVFSIALAIGIGAWQMGKEGASSLGSLVGCRAVALGTTDCSNVGGNGPVIQGCVGYNAYGEAALPGATAKKYYVPASPPDTDLCYNGQQDGNGNWQDLCSVTIKKQSENSYYWTSTSTPASCTQE